MKVRCKSYEIQGVCGSRNVPKLLFFLLPANVCLEGDQERLKECEEDSAFLILLPCSLAQFLFLPRRSLAPWLYAQCC